MYIQFKEARQSRYILQTEGDPKLHLLMPFPSSENLTHLKNFFEGPSRALDELKAYKEALEFDIQLMSSGVLGKIDTLDEPRRYKKLRLNEIVEYIAKIEKCETQLGSPHNYEKLIEHCKDKQKITLERSGFKDASSQWLEFATLGGNPSAFTDPQILLMGQTPLLRYELKPVLLGGFLAEGDPKVLAKFLLSDTTDINGNVDGKLFSNLLLEQISILHRRQDWEALKKEILNNFTDSDIHLLKQLQAKIIDKPITVEAVAAFGQDRHCPQYAQTVQLNCPESVLAEFKQLLHGTSILGSSFVNPYTHQEETFPTNVTELTARHLQILARNERVNTTGEMKTILYEGRLTEDQIGRLRCLVKASNVAGVVDSVSYGGFPMGRQIIKESQKTIVIDQSGLQWQKSFYNTGGMFFYPSDPKAGELPQRYDTWQSQMYKTMYGESRPKDASTNTMGVTWNRVAGVIDLNQVAKAIEVEFSQALDAAVAQGNLSLGPNEQINFKFLKAGMGFFADGLKGLDQPLLENARLRGIAQALERIALLPEAERRIACGKVKQIELPFSTGDASTLKKIETLIKDLGIQWGGTSTEDALAPRPGYVNAITNCGDPHAMIGNEGRYSSVDAAISSNCLLQHLNPGFNARMELRMSPLPFQKKSQPGFAPVDSTSTATTTAATTTTATTTSAQFSPALQQQGFFRPTPIASSATSNSTYEEALFAAVIGIFSKKDRTKQRGQYNIIRYNPTITEGFRKSTGAPSLCIEYGNDSGLDLILNEENNSLTVLNKTSATQFIPIMDLLRKGQIFNTFLTKVPIEKLQEAHVSMQLQNLLKQQTNLRQETPITALCQKAGIPCTDLQEKWVLGFRQESQRTYIKSSEFYCEIVPSERNTGFENIFKAIPDSSGISNWEATNEAGKADLLKQLSNVFPQLDNAIRAAAEQEERQSQPDGPRPFY